MFQLTGGKSLLLSVLAVLYCSVWSSVALHVPAVRDAGERPETLRRRYWGDDTGLCLKKYCLAYTGTNEYINCLREFCQMGLLITPRQLIARDSPWQLDGNIEVEQPMTYENDGRKEYEDDDKSDVDTGVAGGRLAALCIGHGGNLGDEPCTSRSCMIRQAVYNRKGVQSDSHLFLCATTHCADSIDILQCFRNVCCDQSRGAIQKRSTGSSEKPLARKRRVNDETTQCIQSYCSGASGYDRMLCIVNRCNRG